MSEWDCKHGRSEDLCSVCRLEEGAARFSAATRILGANKVKGLVLELILRDAELVAELKKRFAQEARTVANAELMKALAAEKAKQDKAWAPPVKEHTEFQKFLEEHRHRSASVWFEGVEYIFQPDGYVYTGARDGSDWHLAAYMSVECAEPYVPKPPELTDFQRWLCANRGRSSVKHFDGEEYRFHPSGAVFAGPYAAHTWYLHPAKPVEEAQPYVPLKPKKPKRDHKFERFLRAHRRSGSWYRYGKGAAAQVYGFIEDGSVTCDGIPRSEWFIPADGHLIGAQPYAP